MNTITPSSPAAASQSTYNGFYLRNNRHCNGQLPFKAPFHLCPDIIYRDRRLSNPQAELGNPASWETSYPSQPVAGSTNYYYVRGLNGSQGSASQHLFLYYMPAQLILLPATWKNNVLKDQKGTGYVPVNNIPSQNIGVGEQAFVWQNTPAPSYGSDFYSFVGRVSDANGQGNSIPTISSWTDMSKLFTQTPGFGFATPVMSMDRILRGLAPSN